MRQTLNLKFPLVPTPAKDDYMAQALYDYHVFCRESKINKWENKLVEQLIATTPFEQLDEWVLKRWSLMLRGKL